MLPNLAMAHHRDQRFPDAVLLGEFRSFERARQDVTYCIFGEFGVAMRFAAR